MAERIPDFAPIGMAHQFEQQRDAVRRVLYEGRMALQPPLQDYGSIGRHNTLSTRFSGLELRICPGRFFFRKLNLPLCQTFLRKPPPESFLAALRPTANFASIYRRRQSHLPICDYILRASAQSLGMRHPTHFGARFSTR